MESVSMAACIELYWAMPANPLKDGASQITPNNTASTTNNVSVERRDGCSENLFMG